MKHFFTVSLSVFVVGMLGFFFIPTAQALTVSPAKIEISGDPGKTVTGEIQLLNEQNATETFYSSFANFDSNGETGAPHFLDSTTDLASWMKTDAEVSLEKNELRKVAYSITIPQNAEPGGHFAAIFWGTQPPTDKGGGEVAIGGKVGILVLLKVSGNIKQGGGLVDFFTKTKQKFFAALPVLFEYRVSNTGGDRVVPDGTISVRNLGLFPSVSLPANKKGGSVLPNSTRRIEVAWGQDLLAAANAAQPGFFGMAWQELKNFHFGWYRATLNIALGPDEKASASYSFMVVPWQLLLLLIIILIPVVIIGFFAIRKYNAWIVSKVMERRSAGGPPMSGNL